MKRDWLQAIREKQGFTQTYVAKQVGIAQPSYHNMEKGKISPSVPTAKAIATVLGFDWTRFYDEPNDSPRQTCV